MNKKVIIAIVIVFVVIVIGVVGFLIYRNNRRKKEQEAQQQMAILQQQLATNPNMPAEQKGNLLGQIANLAAVLAQIKSGAADKGTPDGPLPGLGGAGWNPEPSGFPLVKGNSGTYVKNLQMAINAKCGNKLKSIGMLPLTTDGKFGPLTEKGAAACLGTTSVNWQQYKGLTT